MKTKLIFLMFLITSCASQNFYQIHKVEPVSNVVADGKYLVYDDENCRVFYNFWEENGDAGFKIYNKTDSTIYLNMEESFFIINGIANDYFKNRVFTESRSSQKTTGRQISANRSAIYDGYGMVQVSNFLAGRSTETSTTTLASLSMVSKFKSDTAATFFFSITLDLFTSLSMVSPFPCLLISSIFFVI